MTVPPADGRLPVRTVFFGSGQFGLPVLDALVEHADVELVGVVSAPDRPVGRGGVVTPSPVAARATELGLTLVQPERLRTAEGIAAISSLQPGLGVLADYGQLVPATLIETVKAGILNVHPSLLPRHRGASPIPAVILAGDKETGVTIISMDPGLDTGPIVAARSWPLAGDEAAPDLERRAATTGAELLGEVVGPWVLGELPATPQEDTDATLTRPLRRDDGRLDMTRQVAHLERQVRAYQPWPGSFIDTRGGRLIVWRASVPADVSGGPPPPPGTIGQGSDLRISAGDGWLVLDEVQPAGGRRMSGTDWLIGRPGLRGSSIASR